MFDYSQYNGSLGLICLFIYILMLIKNWSVYKGKIRKSHNYTFVTICMLLYSVLGFLEWDTYHYYSLYEMMINSYSPIHVEEVYFRLIKVLPHNYLLWRFCIWGGATFLMIYSARKLKLNSHTFCFVASILFITRLTVSRGGLGLAMLVFCSILLIQSIGKRKIIAIVFAFLGILFSIYLHSSMIVFVFCMMLAFILPFNKKIIIISLLLFPFLYVFVMQFLGPVITYLSLNEEQTSLFLNYTESEKIVSNFFGWIPIIIEKTAFILLIIYLSKRIIFDNIPLTSAHRLVFKFSYILIYLSLLFFEQETSSWISSRTLHAASFGLVLCTTSCFDNIENIKRNKLEKIVIIMLILNSLWGQLYFIYKY